MSQRRRLFLSLVILALLVVPIACRGDVRLEPGARSSVQDTARTIVVELPADAYVQLAVVQMGLDVETFLFEPGSQQHRLHLDSDRGSRYTELFEFVSREAGEYRLDVRPFGSSPTGGYAVEIAPLREATEELRRRAEAYENLYRFESLDLTSPEAREYGELLLREAARWIPTQDTNGWFGLLERRWGKLLRYGDRDAAIRAFDCARTLLLDSTRHVERMRATNDLAMLLLRERADLPVAELRFGDVLRDEQEHRYPAGRGTAHLGLAEISFLRGDVASSRTHLDDALTAFEKAGSCRRYVEASEKWAQLHLYAGRPAEALSAMDKADAMCGATAVSRSLRAWRLYTQGRNEVDPSKERAMIVRSRELYKQLLIEETDEEKKAWLGIRYGLVLAHLGHYDESDRIFEQAHRSLSSHGSEGGARALINWSWATLRRAELEVWPEARRDHYLAALGRSAEALASLRGPPSKNDRLQCALTRAYALWGLERLEDAEIELVDALNQLEGLVEANALSPFSYGLRGARRDHREALVDLRMERHRKDPTAGHDLEALLASEDARVATLRRQLIASDAVPELTDVEHARLRRVRDSVELADLEVRSLRESVGISSSQRELDEATRIAQDRLTELRALQDRLGVRSSSVTPTASTAQDDLARLQTTLGKSTLVLSYHLGAEHGYVWAITRESVTSRRLEEPRQVRWNAKELAHSLARGAPLTHPRLDAPRKHLSQALLAPVVSELRGKDRVLLSLDGDLHRIPFRLLMGPRTDELAKEPALLRIPSIPVLQTLRTRAAARPPSSQTELMLIDPVLGPDDPRAAQLPQCPSPASSGPTRLDLARVAHTGPLEDVLRSLLPRGRLEVVTGLDASRRSARSGKLSGPAVIYIGAHGVVDGGEPDRSGVVLSQYDEQGCPELGILRAYEVAQLDLDAELVILAACSSGSGAAIPGEGLVGLSHAFLRAGADATLVSLWPVDDVATGVLMEQFHVELWKHGKSPSEALRAAQLWVSEETSYEAPYYWAAFVLVGYEKSQAETTGEL